MRSDVNPIDEDLEFERYELAEPPKHGFTPDRREFIQVLGAGVVVAVAAGQASGQRRGRGGERRSDSKLSERFHLGADGVVTVLTGKVEVGQGSRTLIAQAAAEELRLPIDKIRVLMADTDLCPDDGGTAGSRTTPSTVPQVRTAAARLRSLLVTTAAEAMETAPSSVKIQEGKFVVPGTSKSVDLAALVGQPGFETRLQASAASSASVRAVEQWEVLGQTVAKLGAEEIVTGAAKYPSDVVREGMHYGKVLRPPSLGAKLVKVDLEPAKAMEGGHVVRVGDFVGCTAPTSWQAKRAVELIAETAQWQRPPHPSSDHLFQHLKETAQTTGTGRSGPRTDTWGDGLSAMKGATLHTDAAYTIAYIHHAPMEPRAAVAEWKDGRLTVWTGTQQPSRVRSELAAAFRLPEDRVRVVVPDTGGGFGGKHTGEAAVEAARLAKAAGRPVSLRWTREEECTWAYCRPAGLIEVQAGLDDKGQLVAWDFTNYNAGGSAIATPYQVANGRTRFVPSDSPLRQGSYRALASTANTFARESAMDELAHLAKLDPFEFRLAHLPEGRLRDVLMKAADHFRWRERRHSAGGRGVGIACGTEKGSYVAACAEVEVKDGRFRVTQICQAYECGAIQNPGNLQAQVEGCIVMGLGGALYEEVLFKDGVVSSNNFSSYTVPRMRDVPEIAVVLCNRPDLPSVGAGETPIIAVAPAIANAVFHACGVRIRSMPLRTAELTPA